MAVSVPVAGVNGTVGAHGARGSQVRDILRQRVLGADGGDAALGGFAGFGEGVIAGVKVLAFLKTRRTD